MEVIILAGGLGTRLSSVVNDVPKCMAEVAGNPFLHYILQQLLPVHPEQIILSLGYKHEIIEEWISKLDYPYPIVCKSEPYPLGTGGAIKFAFSAVKDDSAIVINGDTFFDIDLSKFQNFFQEKKKETVISLKPMTDFDRYGSVEFDANISQIINFREKKYCKEGYINGGIYALKKSELNTFPEKFSLENEYFPIKVEEQNLFGFVSDGFFIDIGIPEDYKKAQIIFSRFINNAN